MANKKRFLLVKMIRSCFVSIIIFMGANLADLSPVKNARTYLSLIEISELCC